MNRTAAFTPSVRQLRAFRAVYQLRKLSAAAEQLSVTQSAVSVLVRQLEDGLGTRLFDRTSRSKSPPRCEATTSCSSRRHRIRAGTPASCRRCSA